MGAALAPLGAPLAGCAKAGEAPAQPAPAAGESLIAVAEVPVGGAVIADGTVVAQPSPGVFTGFAARCTHAGCALAVKDGRLECPCHGSQFALDGSVVRGPAVEPLAPRPVTARGGEVVAG